MRLSIAAIFCLLSGAAAAGTVNSPEPGFNAQHSAYNAYETKLSAANVGSLTLKWTFPTSAEITATPVQLGNRVFALSTDGNLYAIDATTGKKLWSYVVSTNGAPSGWGVAASGGMVYTNCQLDYNGGLYGGHSGVCALKAATGALVWNWAIYNEGPNAPVNSAPYNPPIVDNGMVFMGEADTGSYFHVGYVQALNATTGAGVWGVGNCGDTHFNNCNFVQGAPFAAYKGYLYYNSGAANGGYGFPGAFCKVAEATGAIVWCHYIADSGVAPSFGNGRVYFSVNSFVNDSTNAIVALDDSTGAVDWTYSTGTNDSSPHLAPALANGTAYFTVGSNSFGTLYALSENQGKLLFASPSAYLTSGVTVANGVLFAQCYASNNLCAFDAKTGATLQTLGTHPADASQPLVANGVEITVCNYNNLCEYAP
jgi:outer membrane protein assembly factor BamB